jgi:hypothetical protein
MELPPALAYIIDSDRHGRCSVVTIGYDGKANQIGHIAITSNRHLNPRIRIHPFIHQHELHVLTVCDNLIWIGKIYDNHVQVMAYNALYPNMHIDKHPGYKAIEGTICEPIRLDSYGHLCFMKKYDAVAHVVRIGLDGSICDVMFHESLSVDTNYVTCYDPSCDTHYIIRRDTRLSSIQCNINPLMDRVKMVYVGGGELMSANIWGNNMTIQRRFNRTEYNLTIKTAGDVSQYYDLSSVKSWVSDSVTVEVGMLPGEEPDSLSVTVCQQTDGTTYNISSDYNIREDRRECIILASLGLSHALPRPSGSAVGPAPSALRSVLRSALTPP